MIDPNSRYATTPTAEHVTPLGETIVYLRRRFIDPASAHTPIARVVVTEQDRLDLISARTIGDPLQYWSICDANEAMRPADLESPAGRVLWVGTKE